MRKSQLGLESGSVPLRGHHTKRMFRELLPLLVRHVVFISVCESTSPMSLGRLGAAYTARRASSNLDQQAALDAVEPRFVVVLAALFDAA